MYFIKKPRNLLSVLAILTFVGCTTNQPTQDATQQLGSPGHEPSLSMSVAQSRKSLVSDVHYLLKFDLTDHANGYKGDTEITFKYKEGLRTPLRVDFYEGKITSLKVNGSEIPPDYNGKELFVPASMLVNGENKINIVFTHPFSRDGSGLVRFEDPEDKRVYTYTDLEPYDANRVFPCFDQPDLKAKYTMEVLAPKDWEVVSSTRENKIEPANKDARLWYFPTSAKFSTYIWSLHAGPYKVWSDPGKVVPLRLFARQSLAKYVRPNDWFKVTNQGFQFYNKYFGYDYPYKKYDQLMVPEFNAGAMENVAAVTFTERFISRGEPSQANRRSLAEVILHEMAHMWFGDLVTMKWWNDLWLNESFATYMAHLALYEATDFKEFAWRDFAGTKGWAYWEDQLVTTHPIEAVVPDTKQATANFDGITYGKGASVLKQIDFYITPEKFQKGVQNYFKKYAETNTELKDFMNSLSEAYGSSLDQWQKLWLQTASLNTIHVDLKCDGGLISDLTLSQTYLPDYPYVRPHRFKVGLYYPEGKQVKISDEITVKMEDEKIQVAEATGKKCPTLIDPNVGDYGYFKVNLDKITLAQLPKNISKIADPFARQNYWSTLWEMVRDSQLELNTYSKLALSSLNTENDTEVLREILGSVHGSRSGSRSVLFYMPEKTEKERLEKVAFAESLERLVWKRLMSAKPGSEQQKIWFDSTVRSAQTPYGLSNLKALLDGNVKLKKHPVDQDKRWNIINQLAVYNYGNADKLIDKEYKKDSSSNGQRYMMGAKAALPSWDLKKQWLDELIKKDSTYSFDQLKSVMYNVFPYPQMETREKYADDFFKNLATLSAEREGFYTRVYSGLAPINCEVSEDIRITNFLENNAKLHPSVEKSLKVTRQENERCFKIRSLSRK